MCEKHRPNVFAKKEGVTVLAVVLLLSPLKYGDAVCFIAKEKRLCWVFQKRTRLLISWVFQKRTLFISSKVLFTTQYNSNSILVCAAH